MSRLTDSFSMTGFPEIVPPPQLGSGAAAAAREQQSSDRFLEGTINVFFSKVTPVFSLSNQLPLCTVADGFDRAMRGKVPPQSYFRWQLKPKRKEKRNICAGWWMCQFCRHSCSSLWCGMRAVEPYLTTHKEYVRLYYKNHMNIYTHINIYRKVFL